MSDSFVHLHVHTEYSTLDSTVRTKELVARAKELNMPAVAMTDHGNLYAAIEFYQNATGAGIKPILGCEVYVAPASLHDKKEVPGRKDSTHLTLLAKNETGWKNLVKLVSVGHLEGDYLGEPRVDREHLAKFAEGLICLSGCINGSVNEWLHKNDIESARQEIITLRDIFGADDFYLELNDQGLEIQQSINTQLKAFSEELGLKMVATNDVHFLHKDDAEAQDVLICIGQGRLLLDENRKSYPVDHYFKTPEEMRTLYADFPGACDNTLEIANKCNVELVLDPTSSEKYPQFESPDGSPREEYFRKVCFEGLEKRYANGKLEEVAKIQNITPEEMQKVLDERLDYEIGTINELGFASYFLITADFIQWGRDNDIPVGPGRGSAAGSLVAYTMGITDICPMRFGLLFERFLNPERVSPPDVDIDFCQTRRVEVIEYVRQKYGERSVSHIITYGTLGAKSVIRDVSRVMGISYGDADMLAKMIEAKPGVKLQKEYDEKEELRDIIQNSGTWQELWNYAIKLEGLNRNTGVHAAGVVIGDRALDEHCALTRGNEGEVVTQCDMGAITELGLLKMDFLGLKNMTVIQDAVNHIRKHTPDFDINNVSLEDGPALALLNRGETMGVFQLESGGMVETCKKYGIEKIEDIIDLLALYRPGAMQFIDQMIEVKKGITKVQYEHPMLETICGDTYGVMIYQEQVQNAAKMLAGYSLGGADLLRRAMGKKDPSKMAKERVNFVNGCKETNNIEESLANKLFDKIEMFAGYGFNKSHSACYGHISYWTAYLKANFPVEFMSGLLSNELNNTDKIGIFINECHRMDIEVLPPNINKSQLKFAPEKIPSGKMAIRYGLAAIKNVGEGAMRTAIAEREKNGEFSSLDDFSNRLDSKSVNKRILENLVKAGALDWTGESRAAMFHRIEQVVASASSAQRDRAQGQVSLFDTMDFAGAAPAQEQQGGDTPEIDEWSKDERLANEKELLGCYTSGHPLDKYRDVIDSDRFEKIGLLDELDTKDKRARYPFAGMIRHVEHKVTRKGKPFGVLYIEDFTGDCEVVCWSESYMPAREAGLLMSGNVIRLKANVQVDERTETLRLTGSEIKELKARKRGKNGAVQVTLWVARHSENDLMSIRKVLQEHPGDTPVEIHLQSGTGKRATIEASEKLRVKKCAALERGLAEWSE
ncbi:DNA polymerase III subunit alpha [Verrucomicrobiaceae bacterium 5K15]|uniref:DNA polymerase III subunit alpha n=1 Tax=Oceaniferula flava TaxID=2800421 RepID=A0AAE2V8J3_9BACT|nr:DNA polymerase III subunit alpha [Oceaniferula flavus]MBK1855657.1 DNA polymerase III subunit alpha [Oceaniferula flavus]MBM1136963.1 DNA polymerase III subunit alpha [Oceaniferula flavus]